MLQLLKNILLRCLKEDSTVTCAGLYAFGFITLIVCELAIDFNNENFAFVVISYVVLVLPIIALIDINYLSKIEWDNV